jgi:signal transduction histidine kinase
MIGLIVGLLLTFTFLQISTQKDILEKELERRICLMKKNLVEQGALLSDNLARQTEEGIASFNFSHATEIIKKTVSDHEELSYIILMDSSCVAYTHTLQPELQQERLTADEDTFAAVQDKAVINEYEKGGKQFMEMIVPLNVGTGKWGALRLGFSLDVLHKEIELSNKEIRKKIQEIIIRSIITAVLFIIIGAVVVYMISTKLSRPLIRLTESARLLAKGDFAISANIKVNSRDEVGMLAESFTEMAGNLKTSYGKLEEYSRTLEQKVEERTSELREANEKLKELDKIKSDFLSTVSHELRTPLTSVLGFTKIIKKRFEEVIVPQIKTEDGKTLKAMRQIGENVSIIISEGERLTSLINDVLDITKIEAGKVEWKMEPLLMSDIIGQATAATLSLFEQKGLKLIKYVEDNLPVINGDKHRLMQVVINLISNAVKFTDEGIVTCAVRKTGNDVTVSVVDTGRGIDPSDHENVFEKFKQVGDTLTDKPRGTGLGLPICKQIVAHHGGRIWVESEQSKGSTFAFTIPIMMPAISGFDVAAVLKNDPKTSNIPIVINSIVENKERGNSLGVDGYLTKPVCAEGLVREVGLLISKSDSK